MNDIEGMTRQDTTTEPEPVRLEAVRSLVAEGSMDKAPLLLKAMSDSSEAVRREAMNGLSLFPADFVLPRLERLLRDGADANARNAAMETFPRYGSESTSYLLGLLRDEDAEIRDFASVMLGRIKDPDSVEGLIEALADRDENVRHGAAEALGKIGDPRAVDALTAALEDDFWVQYAAVTALGMIGDGRAVAPLLKLLDDEMLCQAAMTALGNVGDPSVVPVLAKMLLSPDPTLRNDAVASLVSIQDRMETHVHTDGHCLPSIKRALDKDELFQHLLRSLEDRDPMVRKNAVIALGWLRKSGAVGRLVQLLSDEELREYAVNSLVSMGGSTAMDLVRSMAGVDAETRLALIRCVDWIGEVKAIEALVPCLKDESRDARLRTIRAMAGALESESVEDALIEMLSDRDPAIRSALIETLSSSRSATLPSKLASLIASGDGPVKTSAIKVLGAVGGDEDLDIIEDSIKDEDESVRAAAFEAMGGSRSRTAPDGVYAKGIGDESPRVRKAAVEAIGSDASPATREKLGSLIKDRDPEIRMAAVEAMGRLGDPAFIERLIEAYATGGKPVKVKAIRALGNVWDRKSSKFLTGLLEEPDAEIKKEVLYALARIQDKRSAPGIIVALEDPDWWVRTAAIRALGLTGDSGMVGSLLSRLAIEEDEVIKKEIIVAVGRLGDERAVQSLLPHLHEENLKIEIINVIEKLGLGDLEYFYNFLKCSNNRLKCLLVEILGRIEGNEGARFLAMLLKDELDMARSRAAEALGRVGDERAIPALLAVQRNDVSENVRKEAARAIRKINERLKK